MQTILGAGGSIGLELARILPEYTDRVRLVGRNLKRIVPSNELFAADLLKPAEVMSAVKGDENTPVRPTSRKGAVRAEVAAQLMRAVEKGEVLIARSADF